MYPSRGMTNPAPHFHQRARHKDLFYIRATSPTSLRNLVILAALSVCLIVWSNQIDTAHLFTHLSHRVSNFVTPHTDTFQSNVHLDHFISYSGPTDDTISGLVPVSIQPPPVHNTKQLLNFTDKTAINFMHFHKTGGVSFKTSLHKFYHKKVKANGDTVLVRDACYSRQKNVKKHPSKPSFLVWRCDWEPLREMSEKDRNNHDFVIGHQFWRNGATTLLNNRDVRTFTVLRHPFDRKISFYYHFFVREIGRNESDVTFRELRDFLLYDNVVTDGKLGRDLGPNYMAGRLLSDGVTGFVGDNRHSHFQVNASDVAETVAAAVGQIRRYVFVGLQEEPSASKCMLRKVVEAFNAVNDIDGEGVGLIDKDAKVLNRGSYDLDAKAVWNRFSVEERARFERKEIVDLAIYEEGKKLFRLHVERLRCAHRVLEKR